MMPINPRSKQLACRLKCAILVVLIILLAPVAAQAATFRSQDNVTIPSDETISDDLYISGGTVTIDGTVNGDVIAAGGNVIINGPIRDDLIVAGGTVNLNGQVGQTARVAGGTINVRGRIGQDLVVAGGNVDVASGATIMRDIVLAGGNATIRGTADRRLYGAIGSLVIDGRIGDDANLEVGELRLTNRAVIDGNLNYRSENRAQIASGARITGETNFRQRPRTDRTGQAVLSFILSFLAAFVFGVLLLLLFPARTVEVAETIGRSPWVSLGLGFAALFLVPAAAILLLLLVITIPISLTVVFLYILGLYLAKIFVGLFLGRFITGRFKIGGGNYVALLIGLLIIMLLGLIPFLGGLVRFFYILFGLGAAVWVLYRIISERRTQRPLDTTT